MTITLDTTEPILPGEPTTDPLPSDPDVDPGGDPFTEPNPLDPEVEPEDPDAIPGEQFATPMASEVQPGSPASNPVFAPDPAEKDPALPDDPDETPTEPGVDPGVNPTPEESDVPEAPDNPMVD